MTNGRGEPFLARWVRRKQAEPGEREREDARVAENLPEASGAGPAAPAPEARRVPADLPAPESLTSASDFTRFMRADVPAASRNAALKTLFTDPHFNVMDGLDIYIDDYTRPDPIPAAMLRDLAQSRMLGLFEGEDEEKEKEKVPAPDVVAVDSPVAAAPQVAELLPAAVPPEGAAPAVAAPATIPARQSESG